MKKKKIQDERVLAQTRKIGNDGFQILFGGLILSVLIQQYMFDAPFSQYAVELILLFISSLYVITRNLIIGNDLFTSQKIDQKLIIINSLVCGITVAVVNTTLNYIKLGDLFKTNIVNTLLISFITFLCATVTSFVVFEMIYIINKKKQKQIEDKLNNEEEINE